jgi:hypothetical protein
MNTKKVVNAFEEVVKMGLTIDELDLLQKEINKLKKVKADSVDRVARLLALKNRIHPVCFT